MERTYKCEIYTKAGLSRRMYTFTYIFCSNVLVQFYDFRPQNNTKCTRLKRHVGDFQCKAGRYTNVLEPQIR